MLVRLCSWLVLIGWRVPGTDADTPMLLALLSLADAWAAWVVSRCCRQLHAKKATKGGRKNGKMAVAAMAQLLQGLSDGEEVDDDHDG